MTKMMQISMFVFAVALVGGCAVQDREPVEQTSGADELAAPAAGAARSGGSTLTCDDLDTFCDASHPCGEGFVCALDPGHCGSNFFGTFPDCGVTATCFPACQPSQPK